MFRGIGGIYVKVRNFTAVSDSISDVSHSSEVVRFTNVLHDNPESLIFKTDLLSKLPVESDLPELAEFCAKQKYLINMRQKVHAKMASIICE